MIMIDPALFRSEWFFDLTVDERYMYLYLLANASSKTGIFEWNGPMINFCAHTNRMFSKEDILSVYDKRIQMVPGWKNTMIIVDYVRFNWLKDGRQIDPVKNRLDRAIVNELNRYGLTIEKLNEMSKHKIQERTKQDELLDAEADRGGGACHRDERDGGGCDSEVRHRDVKVSDADVERMFDGFWDAYPKACPRKTDKKKCRDKFAKILRSSNDAVEAFNRIMNGLEKWKVCATWTKDGGQFIRAPLVWLNGENWNDEPTKGNAYANRKSGTTANSGYQSPEAAGAF